MLAWSAGLVREVTSPNASAAVGECERESASGSTSRDVTGVRESRPGGVKVGWPASQSRLRGGGAPGERSGERERCRLHSCRERVDLPEDLPP
jgi:hypothetical protein